MENDPDIVAMIGASAALTLSGLPFMGPIGAARVGHINGSPVLNPTLEQIKDSDLDLIVAGTREGVLMVESEARELSEDQMLEAVTFGHDSFQPVIDAIIDLAEMAAKEPRNVSEAPAEAADRGRPPARDRGRGADRRLCGTRQDGPSGHRRRQG